MFKFVVILNLIVVVYSLYLPTNTGYPKEVQNAVCNVITKDIQASAVAMTTRQLKGVVSSNELDRKIKQLETKILQGFASIRNTLEKNGFKIPEPVQLTNKNETLSKSSVPTEYEDYFEPTEKTDDYIFNNHFKSLETNTTTTGIDGTFLNNDEILFYNNSIAKTDNGNVYYYFWRIEEINNILQKKGIYISSPDFTVLGHKLHLQFYPSYVPGYNAIMLRPHSKGFLKRHKISLFNQYFTSEISSSVILGLTNDEKMFKIHESMLNDAFLAGDKLLLKLTLYLES